MRLLREGRHWHGRYWWQFTRQTCETTCVKASFNELKDRTIWSSSMYLQQSLEMMRWCIISRSLESIEYLDNSKSHDFLMSKYLRRYCLIGLNMNCLLGVLGKIFKHSFAASCQQTTAPSDHWNHFIPNVNNINLFRCWPARYSPFKQKQGNNDVCCHSFILKWTCTTSVFFLQIWRLSDSRLYTLHLFFLKSYHDIAPKEAPAGRHRRSWQNPWFHHQLQWMILVA